MSVHCVVNFCTRVSFWQKIPFRITVKATVVAVKATVTWQLRLQLRWQLRESLLTPLPYPKQKRLIPNEKKRGGWGGPPPTETKSLENLKKDPYQTNKKAEGRKWLFRGVFFWGGSEIFFRGNT